MHQLTCEKRSYKRELTSHQHEYGQFLFPLQGSLDIQTEWQEINLKPDSFFYLPPTYDHHFRSEDRNEFLILDVPTYLLPEGTSSMYLPLDQQWTSIRYLLLEEAGRQDNKSALGDLTRYVTSKLQHANPVSIDYLHNHYKEALRVETLAEMEHYHPVYYSAWFKKRTGKSLKAYVSELRLKEAKHLLLSSGWSMSRISEELGFENASSFTRWFGRTEGVPPQTFRTLHKG
ncbi:Bifunctional transcriptional activator/DNA repair enzyme AdaA [Bacillus sp. THAF10]|uniref:helix-turn-helix transcriptional regulator n=1 Tax=Bacillus sp. THAF10 TaxID=2587848 RepID=UPI0012690FE6|nr:AraC family transcriptional regulator [Bacillus sp. THAF10]QFT91107.1 Bifunctional transcriptional activator/DNA repair enzyme AdaA [Bacillus sp. THAF10]